MGWGKKKKKPEIKHSTGVSSSLSKVNRTWSNEKEAISYDQQPKKRNEREREREMPSHFLQGHNFNRNLY